MTQSLIVPRNGYSRLLGIRFHPGAARYLVKTPLSELTDLRIDIADITPDLEVLLENVLKNKSQAILTLNSWLQSGLRTDSASKLIERAFCLAKAQTPELRVSAICESLGVSRQYLNRIFNDRVGVDFKTFHRILRLRTLTQEVRSNCENDWSDLAVVHGFYDQSHMINEFKDIVGLTPEEFVGS